MATLPVPSRLSIAGRARAGQMVELRWIAGHPMESGFRVGDTGQPIPRHMITRIRVLLNGRLLLEAEPGTGMAANPYLAFPLLVPADGGTVTVEWIDDAGQRGSVQQVLLVER